jgi:hypothetical protein
VTGIRSAWERYACNKCVYSCERQIYKNFVGNPEGKRGLGDIGLDWSII